MSGVRDEPRNDETDHVADLQNGQSLARIFAAREADLHPSASRGLNPATQRTLANRRDTIAVWLTLVLSRMRIAPHSDTHREAPRLRLTRDDAFVANAHQSVEKFGSCERSDFFWQKSFHTLFGGSC
jgi:hypothetical protein